MNRDDHKQVFLMSTQLQKEAEIRDHGYGFTRLTLFNRTNRREALSKARPPCFQALFLQQPQILSGTTLRQNCTGPKTSYTFVISLVALVTSTTTFLA